MSIHKTIANAMPKLSHLECMECGRRAPLNTGKAAGYLATGWPKCCSYTMRLFTQEEASKASASKASARQRPQAVKDKP